MGARENRLRRVQLDYVFVRDLVLGEGLHIVVRSGLPRDAHLLAIEPDPMHGRLDVILQSSEFEPLKEDQIVPLHHIEVEVIPKCDGLDGISIIQIKPSTRNALWGMMSSDEIYDGVINRLIRHWDDSNRTIDMLQAEIEKLKKRLQELRIFADEHYENIPMGYLTGNKAVDVSHMIAYISKYHDKVLGILDQEEAVC